MRCVLAGHVKKCFANKIIAYGSFFGETSLRWRIPLRQFNIRRCGGSTVCPVFFFNNSREKWSDVSKFGIAFH